MNKPSILVVEDDVPVRCLITTTLKTHGYKYLTASNGETAIMMTTSHNPDIMLLDLGLPDIDGIEVIRSVRTWSNLPIIVLSARSEDSDKIEALDNGADDYLTKPYDLEVFMARVEARLRAAHPKERAVRFWTAADESAERTRVHRRDRPESDAEGVCGAAVSGAAPEPQRQRTGAVRGGLAAADGRQPACRAHDDLTA